MIKWCKAIKKKFFVRKELATDLFQEKSNPLDWHGPIRVKVTFLQTSHITLLTLQKQIHDFTWGLS